MDGYMLPDGYRTNAFNHVDKTTSRVDGQRAVYRRARDIMRERGMASVLDVGCGNGAKLREMFIGLNATGTEVEPAYSWLVKNFPGHRWLMSDLLLPPQGRFDMVVCADVVEHLADPDAMMEYLAGVDFGVCVMSTPDGARFGPPLGPPRNPHHVREWTLEQFKAYAGRWFDVAEQVVLDDSQVLVMSKKNKEGR